jgi:steroid 5-alpha reductase family enzyme
MAIGESIERIQEMNHAVTKTRSLVLVGLSYAMALACAWATIQFAPIDDLLYRTLAADVVATLVIFGWSYVYDNSSFYDAYWSVIPIAIVSHWMTHAEPGVPPFRTWAIATIIWIWGARLTFNWARGWTGLAHEDWRYIDFRTNAPGFYWAISFSGFHFFPTLIVFAGLAAAFPALVHPGRAPGLIDVLALATGLLGIGFEWLADRQLHAFVSGGRQPGETLRRGLWRHSRHPNYLGEMLIWWSLFLFGLAADPDWAAWAILAPVAMCAMFFFVSIPLIEKRSLERRTEYQQVIDETSMLIPLPRRKSRSSETASPN